MKIMHLLVCAALVCTFALFMTPTRPCLADEEQRWKTVEDLPMNLRQRIDELYAARNRKFTPLDGVVPEFSVADLNVPEAVAKLSNERNVLCGIEVIPWPADSKEQSGVVLKQVSLSLKNATPRRILNELVSLDPTFTWIEDRGIANVVMRQALENPSYPLNIRIPEFQAKDRPYSMVFGGDYSPSLFALPHVVDKLGIIQAGRSPREFEPRLTVDMTDASVRRIINQVAREVGMSWTMVWMNSDPEGRSGALFFMIPHIAITGPLRSNITTEPIHNGDSK